MRALTSMALAIGVLGASVAVAGDLESGIPVGKRVPAFQVVKCGGADDGVKEGQQLCYR